MEEQDKKKKNSENVKVWRLNNKEKYNEYQRNHYKKKMENEEERKKFNERCRINSKRLRDEKNNGEIKPKGRPRKSHIVLINDIPLVAINQSLSN
tara:strand:- start:471 stop:755 length:285 start_codon:yes stop_codon:yes gene_type:complete